ncbi:MAG: hypothetical protein CW345_08950 [Firmicutes bacterium]|nr:hypothetical protein [Bacillota bacterium]MBO2521911.1 hypothetical protein [Bacillota bacterium]
MAPEPERVRPIDDSPRAVFLILLAGMVAVPFAAGLVAGIAGASESPLAKSGAALVQQAALALLTVQRLRRLGVSLASLRALVDDAKVALQGLAGGAGLVLVNLAASQASALLFLALLGPERLAEWLAREQGVLRELLSKDAGPLHLGLAVFIAVGTAPFVEELFFRGYAYPVFKRHLGRRALWASALVFAAVHFYIIGFLPIFVIGVLLARLYERTGSLASAILAHAVANAGVAILVFWAQRAVG